MKKDDLPKVLVVMSHPDDAEILVGGTVLHLHDLGCPLGILTMTAGDCGSASHTQEEITRVRYQEACRAAESIGAWYDCVGLRDLEVFYNERTLRRVVECFRKFQPEIVLTHSPSDYMLDHEETTKLARAATFAFAVPLFRTFDVTAAPAGTATPCLYYADPVEGVDIFGDRVIPRFYVDISDVIERKKEFLSTHASQREWLRRHHGVDEYLIRMSEWAAQNGKECDAPYAEGLRQHLGHGHPSEPRLQNLLEPYTRTRKS